MGFGGELDLHANALSVAMARERFQRDDKWTELGRDLLNVFEEKAIKALDSGFLASSGDLDPPEVRRCLLVWHWALREAQILDELKSAVRERILSTVPFHLAGTDRRASLRSVLSRGPEPHLYYRRVGSPAYMPRQIEDEGLPINFNEEIGYTIRIGALRAWGYAVVETGYLTFTWQLPGQPQAATNRLDEYQVVHDCLSVTGEEIRDISQAPESDLNLDDFEKL